ncbi:MAG: hypothetical protein L3J93_02685 [Thermoplasmata archaeon]|nr:hypothetical protein [Thermoplasmata archaeon]
MAPRTALAVLIVLLLAVSAPSLPLARGVAYPVLPIPTQLRFLTNLSVPALDPGTTESVQASLQNPLSAPINGTVLSFEVYSFNPFGADSPSPPPSDSAPVFQGPGANGSSIAIAIGTFAGGGSYVLPRDHAVSISVPGSAPSGTYAIRTSLAFHQGPQAYLLESRGYFSDATWANATILANGTPTLNVSRLGVSGVLPETSVFVKGLSLAPWIYGLLGGALVLAGVGGYLAWRRLPKSRSGARSPLSPKSAERALGTSRTSDGD